MKPDRILQNWFRRIKRVRECEHCGAGHERGAVMQYCVGISFGDFAYGYFWVDCQEGPEYREFPRDTTWYRFDLSELLEV